MGGQPLKGGGVVPAGVGGAAAGGRLVKDDAQGGGPAAKGGGNPGGQPVSGGGADDQHPLLSMDGGPALYIFRLEPHIFITAGGVGSRTDKSSRFGLYHHKKQDSFRKDYLAGPAAAGNGKRKSGRLADSPPRGKSLGTRLESHDGKQGAASARRFALWLWPADGRRRG